MSSTGGLDQYQIVIAGELDQTWSEWLGGMEVRSARAKSGRVITILTGSLPDQACLRGILGRIWDLDLSVISVQQIESEDGGMIS